MFALYHRRLTAALFFCITALLAVPTAWGQAADIGDPPVLPDTPVPGISAKSVLRIAPSAAGNWYDTSDRNAVREAWNLTYLPALSVPTGWNGDVAAGVPGTTTQAYKNAVAQLVNWFRAMAGVPAVITMDPTYSAKAQEAAMMFSVNRNISHLPPANWINYTANGAEAARNSNICYGWEPPTCILAYMVDTGANNSIVGHRRWILYPQTEVMGTGDVPSSGPADNPYPAANDLWVFDNNTWAPRPATREEYVAWPPPGYVPYQVVGPRWSFAYAGADFSNATVSMTRNGSSVPVRLEPYQTGYGENTLVWVPDNADTNSFLPPQPPAADTPVTVTVSNVRVNGVARNFTYTVTIFDPSVVPNVTFTLSPTSTTVPSSGGSGSATLQSSSQTATWGALSTAPWLHITSAVNGRGNATLAWSADANTSSQQRVGKITVGSAQLTITESGAPCTYTFDQPNGSLPYNGGSNNFVVTVSPADCGLQYTYSGGLTVNTIRNGAAVTVAYSAGANTTGAARQFSITVAGQKFSISQPGTAPGPQTKISGVGVFRSGFLWILDKNGNHQVDSPADAIFPFGGVPGDIPVTGDWNGSGTTKAGVYRQATGQWLLDYNGNGVFDSGDRIYNFGGVPGDIPVTGDWTGTGTTKIGVFRNGFFWLLDNNGDGVFDAGDAAFAYGGVAGDRPVVGDWTGDGRSKVGLFRQGFLWILDANNSHSIDAADSVFPYGGLAGDVPVVGDWTGSGVSRPGIFRSGFFWILDTTGNHGIGAAFAFGGAPGDIPVVGHW